ncbi:HSH155 U2 snRNP spliceosome subunit, partial [Spraguea lophii 42_110]
MVSNNDKIIIDIDEEKPNNRREYWESTPRTVTQSKRLKWDQTPIGTTKMVEMLEKANLWDIPPYEIEETEYKNINFNIDDLIKILPSKGYNVYSYNKKDFKKEIFEIIYAIKNGEKIKDFKMWKKIVYEVLRDNIDILIEFNKINNILIENITHIIINSTLNTEETINLLNLIKLIFDDENTNNECKCCAKEESITFDSYYIPDTEILKDKENIKKKPFTCYNKELILILSHYTMSNEEKVKYMAKNILKEIFMNKCYKELLLEIKDYFNEFTTEIQISYVLFNMVEYYSLENFVCLFEAIKGSDLLYAKRILIHTVILILKVNKTGKIFYLIDILELLLFKDKIMLAADGLSVVCKTLGMKLEIVKELENLIYNKNIRDISIDYKSRKLINLYVHMTNVDKTLESGFFSILDKIILKTAKDNQFLMKILSKKRILNKKWIMVALDFDKCIILENEEGFYRLISRNIKNFNIEDVNVVKERILEYIRDKELFNLGLRLLILINNHLSDEDFKIILLYLKNHIEDDKTIALLPKTLKFLKRNDILDIVQMLIQLFENKEKITISLKILSKIIIYLDEDDLHHFTTILYEEISSQNKNITRYHLKPFLTLFNHIIISISDNKESKKDFPFISTVNIDKDNENKYKQSQMIEINNNEIFYNEENPIFNSVISSLPFTMEEFIYTLNPLLKNQDERLTIIVLQILDILLNLKINIKNREFIRIAYEAVDNLSSRNKYVQECSIRVIGKISEKVGYYQILNILLDSLRLPDRIHRNNAALAISVLCQYHNIEYIIPFILTEYSVPDLNIQHGILKSLSFIVKNINYEYINYILYICVDSLKEKDIVHRQMGMDIIKNILIRIKKEKEYSENNYNNKRIDINIF